MYQILVKMNNNKEYSEYNIEKTEKEIIDEYIVPYIRNEDFFLGSSYVNKKNIDEILVKETEQKIEEMQRYLQSQLARNVIYVYSKGSTLRNDYSGKNIVSDLVKKAAVIEKENKGDLKEKKLKSIVKNNKVFIVHGHDDGMKMDVARFIESLRLEPIILHEHASKGKTIIEKIDEYTNVRYGIVLYSPCDTGKSNKEEAYKNRARQNVVFEHGYLIGKLGKDKVTALNKGDIETPSDIGGVIYVTYDNNEGWKIKMIKELKANGFEVDLSKIF